MSGQRCSAEAGAPARPVWDGLSPKRANRQRLLEKLTTAVGKKVTGLGGRSACRELRILLSFKLVDNNRGFQKHGAAFMNEVLR